MKAWALATLSLSMLLLGGAHPATESASRIAALIEQLGDDSFDKREAASKALDDIGVPAVRFLWKAAATSKDPEIRWRAERVIQTIAARVPGLVQKGEEIHRIAWNGIHSYNTTFSADGRYFLAGGDGSTLRLYEVKSGKLLHELTGHTHWAQHAVFLPDGKQALSASMDGTLRLWNLTTGKEVRKLDGHAGGAYSVDVSRDGKWSVSAGADKTVRLWDMAKGKEVRTFEGHTDGCMALFTPDGKQILSSGHDRTMRLWDVASGKEVRTFEGHTAALYGAFALPDGKRALSYSADATARVWNLATGKEEKKLDLGANLADIRGVALSPDGKHILVGTNGPYMVRLLELASGKEVHRFSCLTSPRGLSFSRDGRLAAGGSWRGFVYLWRVPGIFGGE
jgi:WD40 repeat protein